MSNGVNSNPDNIYGDVCYRRQRRKRQKLLVTDLLADYAKNSTLHGLRYVADRNLTVIEKLFWFVTFTASCVCCSYLINNVYIKWKTSPVIVTVSERLVSVGEIPFPSVTICPQIKSKASIYNYSSEYDNVKFNKSKLLEREISKFSHISMICDVPLNSTIHDNKFLTNVSLIHDINYVAPNISEISMFCLWHSKKYRCDQLFHKVYTAEGVCYNMNGLAAQEMFRDTVQTDYAYSDGYILSDGWSLAEGYTRTTKYPFPKQGRENGANPDLVFLLRSEIEDRDGFCNGMHSGFKIYIKHPADHPQSSLHFEAAVIGQSTSISISADILTSDPVLEHRYTATTRQCYFQTDRELRYFKIYTTSNCRLECLSNYTYEQCGCVAFYMPHDNSSEICGMGKRLCMMDALESLAEKELEIMLNKRSDGCQCLAACNSTEYSTESITSKLHFKKYMRKVYHSEGRKSDHFISNKLNYSKFELYFKKPQFVSMRRSELFGLTDFLANTGGLLGVFLGFSFLSLIELFYFITLRLGCTLKVDLKEEKIRIKSVKVKNDLISPVVIEKGKNI